MACMNVVIAVDFFLVAVWPMGVQELFNIGRVETAKNPLSTFHLRYLLHVPKSQSPLTPPPEESLLVLRTLGIQTTTLSSSYLLPATTRFIPTSQIRDIFIHEAFRGFEVRFYLCVVVEGEGEAVVVFPVSLIRTPFFLLNNGCLRFRLIVALGGIECLAYIEHLVAGSRD